MVTERKNLEIPLAGPLQEHVSELVMPHGVLVSLDNALRMPAGEVQSRYADAAVNTGVLNSLDGTVTALHGLYGSQDNVWAAANVEMTDVEIPALIPHRDSAIPGWGDMTAEPLDGRRWFPLGPIGADLEFGTEGSVQWLCDFAATDLYYFFVTRGQNTAGTAKQFISAYSREHKSRVLFEEISSDFVHTLPIRITAEDDINSKTSEVLLVGVSSGGPLKWQRYSTEHEVDDGEFTANSVSTFGFSTEPASAGGWDLRKGASTSVLVYVASGTNHELKLAYYDGSWTDADTEDTGIVAATYPAQVRPHICSDSSAASRMAVFYFDDSSDSIRAVSFTDTATPAFTGSLITLVSVSGLGFTTDAEPTRIVGELHTASTNSLAVEDAQAGIVYAKEGTDTSLSAYYGYNIATREWGLGGGDRHTICAFHRQTERTSGGETIRETVTTVASVGGTTLLANMFEASSPVFDLDVGTGDVQVAIPGGLSELVNPTTSTERHYYIPFLARSYANTDPTDADALRLSTVRLLRFSGAACARVTGLQTGIVGGGSPVGIDTKVVPLGLPPPNILVEEGSAGSLSAGTYGVAVVALRSTGRGDLIRSAPSFSDVTIAASKEIDVTVRRLIGEQSPLDVSYEVYATPTTTSSDYIYQTTIQPFDAATASVSLDATLADAGTQVYTAGGELSNNLPPPALSMALAGNRLFLLDGSQTTRVWPSKPKLPGQSWAWSLLQAIDFPEPLVAIASMDGRLIGLSEESVFVVGGGGPDASGYGAFSPVEKLAVGRGAGCGDTHSVVEVPGGLMYQSFQRGCLLLSRNLQVSDIGAAVSDSTATCLRAIDVPSLEHVRFYQSNDKILVFSYGDKAGGWSVWDTSDATDAISVLTSRYAASVITIEDGVARREWSTGVFQTSYSWGLTTGWIKLAGLTGFSRLHWIYLLGTSRGAFDATVSVYYDYETTATESFTFSGTGDSVDPELFRFKPSVQKCTAIKFNISIDSGVQTDRGLKLAGLGMQYLVKSKTPRGSSDTL